ncbi:hypothetical protein [Nocardia sp. NPDC050710]|uniref:hypothetical protein n=1 Tax=Nocardia sp. NPDC050710 TaxID=3157220 RepID=UPI0033D792F6
MSERHGRRLRRILQADAELSPDELDHLRERAWLYSRFARYSARNAARKASDPHEHERWEHEHERAQALLRSERWKTVDEARRVVLEYPELLNRLDAASGQEPYRLHRLDPDDPAGYFLDLGAQGVYGNRCPIGTVFDPEATELPDMLRGACVPRDEYDPCAYPELYSPAALKRWASES